jgi:hypothetical protein
MENTFTSAKGGSALSTQAPTAQDVYEAFQQYEATNPPPSVFTVEVGTFDPLTSQFTGLKTQLITIGEPRQDEPGLRPTIPPPRFEGAEYITVSTDAQGMETVRRVPAPIVPLAPVVLQFAVTDTSKAWEVTVNGFTTTVAAGQGTVAVAIWDTSYLTWSIGTYRDELYIQRPGPLPAAAGAFTIPVMPVAMIYAPPVDSLGKSTASYVQIGIVGTSISYSFNSQTSETGPDPNLTSAFANAQEVSNVLGAIADVLKIAGSKDAEGVSTLSDMLGKFSATQEDQNSTGTSSTYTTTTTTTGTITTNAVGGGPGVGDVFAFYQDVKVIWTYSDGVLQLCPISFQYTGGTVGKLPQYLSTIGISSADQQPLLALDPFVAGGPYAGPTPAERFVAPDGGLQTYNYFGGLVLGPLAVQVTQDTKTTTTQQSSTTDTTSWQPGPILQTFGIGPKGSTVTTTTSNAIGTDQSTTVTLSVTFVAGKDDNLAATIWFDTLFGTWAFQQEPTSPLAAVSGSGATPGETIKLHAGNRTYVTVADVKGEYSFYAKSIPHGTASLIVGEQPAREVNITGGVEPPHVKPIAVTGPPVTGPPVTAPPV